MRATPTSGRRSNNMASVVHRRAYRPIDGDSIAFGETHLFVGEGYVVSVRHGASRPTRRTRALRVMSAVLSRGEDYILYAILDFIVDNYAPVLETLHQKWRRWRRRYWRAQGRWHSSSGSTFYGAIFCDCEMPLFRWWKSAVG